MEDVLNYGATKTYMGVSINGGTHKWMVYKGNSTYKWMITRGYPDSWKS